MPDSNVRRLEFQRTPLPNFHLFQFRVQLKQEWKQLLPIQSQFLPVSVVDSNIAGFDFFGKGYWTLALFSAIKYSFLGQETLFLRLFVTLKLLWTFIKIPIYLNVKFGFSFLLLSRLCSFQTNLQESLISGPMRNSAPKLVYPATCLYSPKANSRGRINKNGV